MLPGLTPGGRLDMASLVGAGVSAVEVAPGSQRFPSGHEQAEPGVVREARRAGLPGPLQGAGRLQGRTHRRDQGEPGTVTVRKRGPPRRFRLLLRLGGQVLTGHSCYLRPAPSPGWFWTQAGQATTACCAQEALSLVRGLLYSGPW